MSGVSMIETEGFAGSRIASVIDGLGAVYADIEAEQEVWKKASPFHCPSGCGACCVHFEPVVFESEALFLAAWLLHHQAERAHALMDGTFVSPRNDIDSGCLFYDPSTPWHCTVYGGRALICRLFAYTGDRGKDGLIRWKPCKELGARNQYGQDELLERFGALPPAMSDITARALSLDPDSVHRQVPLREAVRNALYRLVMLKRFASQNEEEDPDKPNPDSPSPLAPQPLAS